MSKLIHVTIATIVILFGIYIGAVIGVRAAVAVLPKLKPAGDPVANIQQMDIDYSDGRQILPNYQVQPSIDVRKLCNLDCGYGL